MQDNPVQENLAANFCGRMAENGYTDQTEEWRILGQEKDGAILTSWVSNRKTSIGIFEANAKKFETFHIFEGVECIIQASCNQSRTLLLFVKKSVEAEDGPPATYQPFLVEIKTDSVPHPLLEMARPKQVMCQFLWGNRKNFDKNYRDKCLVFIHEECILTFNVTVKKTLGADHDPHSVASNKIDFSKDNWFFERSSLSMDTIARSFIWCQWDPTIQALYYIHYKPTTRISLENNDQAEGEVTMRPTLSAFQFHDDLPTETVLNIPLNLPKIPDSKIMYEDDTIPLRIHDSSLNLVIVSNEMGMLFVCHYYLYQPTQTNVEEDVKQVHFAYSVTVLHHGCLLHCVMPDIEWERARVMKPTFTMHGDHHLLVFQSNMFVHLLDIGVTHEPCCHIVCPPFTMQKVTHLVPCLKWGPLAYDSATLDIVSMSITKSHLMEAFKADESLDNRLSIMHYFMVHLNDMECVADLINVILERPLNVDNVPLLKEALIGGTYANVKKGLPSEVANMIRFLPLTQFNALKPIQAKVSGLKVGLSHETLWNTTMMLLSPHQRLQAFRSDIWTLLWERLHENKELARFSSDPVVEKLMFSLACYQPEALSRCTTPMSPIGMGPKFGAAELLSISHRNYGSNDLPFLEFEECTASKQEHVISVNLREMSVHLVKHTAKQCVGFRWLNNCYDQTPTFVHAVASQFAAAQYETSRTMCVLVCRAAGVDARIEHARGFNLIDQMSPSKQFCFYNTLERYTLAVQSMAYPLPQGFSSFFAYLGYRALSYPLFVQYVQHHVFELQIDVMKAILTDIDDSPEAVRNKLNLLLMLPRSRAKRLLNKWNHPESLHIRARDHVTSILSGSSRSSQLKMRSSQNNNHPMKDKIGPLDTFLDLLTAKASLNEIDFNLVIDATLASLDGLAQLDN